jgi:hypothetical protein
MYKNDSKNNNVTAEVEDPTTGEKITLVGVDESDVENQMVNLFDYGLDEDGVYVGEEAD